MNLVLKSKIFLARNNPEKIMEYLNESQYALEMDEKIDIIVSLKTKELVEYCLSNTKSGFELSSKSALLISYGDKELIRRALRKENFSLRERVSLISEAKDSQLVREYIQKEGKENRYNESLIVSTQDSAFIEDCLLDNRLGLSNQQKIKIILMIEDEKFIKKILDNEKFTLSRAEKLNLIRLLGKLSIVEDYIHDEKLDLTNQEKIDMITGVDKEGFIRQCLKDEKLGFTTEEQTKLIELSGDLKLIKDSLWDKRLALTINQKIRLIVSTEERKFIRKYLKKVALDAGKDEKELLIEESKNIYILKECVELGYIDKDELSNIQKEQINLLDRSKDEIDWEYGERKETNLKLPSKITIGMEIECEGMASSFLKDYLNYGGWDAKDDGSLENGVEIISPVLHPTEKDTSEIYTITNILTRMGQFSTDKCGGHIHIGAKYLTSVQAYMNLLELYCNNEKALYAMSNEEYQVPRSGVHGYAQPISKKMQMALENGTINLEGEEELNKFIKALEKGPLDFKEKKKLNKFIKELKEVQDDRYSGINFMNVNNSKNTIEFRLANGTINPEMWIENANLFGGMVAIAEELAQIQKHGAKKEEDKRKLEIFDKIKQDISEKEKVEILLELAGVEQKTYMQRYKVNIGLIQDNQELEEVFVGKEPLDFKVAKEKFKGKESQEIEVTAHAQIEARDNIVEGHARNLQNERDDRSYTH